MSSEVEAAVERVTLPPEVRRAQIAVGEWIALSASALKSGEPYTDTCREVHRKACDGLATLLDAYEKARAGGEAWRARAERAEGDYDDFRERLYDLVMIDGEEFATGGGPGFKDRKEKAWDRAREPFAP